MAMPRPALLSLRLAGLHATQLDILELYGALAVSIRERHKRALTLTLTDYNKPVKAR